MIKSLITTSIIAFFALKSVAQDKNQKVLTTADYEHATQFLRNTANNLVYKADIRPVWLDNGSFWYENKIATGEEYVLVNPSRKSKKTFATRAELLAQIPQKENETSRPSYFEILSPDGNKSAFIRDYNLWVRDVKTGVETQLTTDGVKNNGYATDNAGWKHSDRAILLWSPDSKKIATFQQDQRSVSDMYLVQTGVGAPVLKTWKYPIPEDEDIIRIERVIIDVANQKVIRLQMPPDARRGTLCDDISCSGSFDDNEWNDDATKLAFVSTSRDHKEEKMRIADAETGVVKDIFEEKVATQYESGQGTINWHYLPKSNEIIWYSERDDWGHLYLYDGTTGQLKNQITTGDFVVTSLKKVDEKNRVLYFMANGKEEGEDPYFSHFYRIDFDGKNLKSLTPETGNHSVSLSPEGNYFVDSFSQPDIAPVSVLRDTKGKLVLNLEKADISALTATGWQPPKPVTVKSASGKWDLHGLMFTPTNLDKKAKYPVINYIYPGPQGGGVGSRSFSAARGDHQALAELGFVVVVIDGTCNPGRSKSFHDSCYGNMADNTLEDQISGIKQLAKQYSYLDLDRVGVWGHSGGGYATAAAMFRYPDFYKVGISESGNHDNRNYEDDWGERYIGLLTQDAIGKSNYEDQANQNFAANLKGKLMLAHGGMDDNVPPYNTYLVIDALIKANKDFDLVIFPNSRHGYGSDSDYMMRRRWDYFVENLMGAEHPKEFVIE
ncbi:MAG: DPP IV N-terminal domain-containing protein [Leeuwenhoekiella sp.]